jgi:very-short-patch-repair endonuclease
MDDAERPERVDDGAHHRARAFRREMTEAEKKLWQVLRSRQTEGYRFRLRVPTGHLIADFVCHEARLIVEIDGGQHDPSSAPAASRTRFLESERYRLLRFWNNEVLDNPEGARIVIAERLRRVHPHPNPPPSWGRARGFRRSRTRPIRPAAGPPQGYRAV